LSISTGGRNTEGQGGDHKKINPIVNNLKSTVIKGGTLIDFYAARSEKPVKEVRPGVKGGQPTRGCYQRGKKKGTKKQQTKGPSRMSATKTG